MTNKEKVINAINLTILAAQQTTDALLTAASESQSLSVNLIKVKTLLEQENAK